MATTNSPRDGRLRTPSTAQRPSSSLAPLSLTIEDDASARVVSLPVAPSPSSLSFSAPGPARFSGTNLRSPSRAGEVDGKTFLTSLHEDKSKIKTVDNTIPNATRINDLYGQLNDLVKVLDDKVKDVLGKHEKDFLSAYRAHMYTVQKEMQSLKQKANEEEAKLRRDQKINSLEQERDWFKTEALRLDALCKNYKKEVDKWKQKALALEEDRQFLEEQIKSAKRQNKLLRAGLERAQTTAFSAIASPEMSSPLPLTSSHSPMPPGSSLGWTDTMKRPSTNSGSRSMPPRPATSMSSLGTLNSSTQRGKRVQTAPLTRPSQGSQMVPMNDDNMQDAGRYVEIISHLKGQLEQEKKNVRILKAAKSTFVSEKNELEEFFLQCVEEVRKEIMKRRARSSAHRLSAPVSRNQRHPASEMPQLDEFTAADRRRVIELLLSNEDVLIFLYERLFPHRATSSPAHPPTDDVNGGVFDITPGEGPGSFPQPDLNQSIEQGDPLFFDHPEFAGPSQPKSIPSASTFPGRRTGPG
eukprot:GILK01003576.1.p1 GENE.GILK01003576.1~~GILK01003576.1.p1  ORF type:complete len:525 (+),score=74.49 GILK01003576.1:89-1663(+)